jgi:hypothetical protein
MQNPSLGGDKKEEEQQGLMCEVCFEAFGLTGPGRLPRLLRCGHSFCTACLARLLLESPRDGGALRCPRCRAATQLTSGMKPDGGYDLSELPRNFALLDLIASVSLASSLSSSTSIDETRASSSARPATTDRPSCANCISGEATASLYCEQCRCFLCVACDGAVHAPRVLNSHLRVAAGTVRAVIDVRPACEHHASRRVEVWCEKDQVAVCTMCAVAVGGPHKGHDVIMLDEAEERARANQQSKLAAVEAALNELDEVSQHESAKAASERASASEAREAIALHFDQLAEVLMERKRKLESELDAWAQEREAQTSVHEVELAESKRLLEIAGRRLQQQLQQQRRSMIGLDGRMRVGEDEEVASVEAAKQATAKVKARPIGQVSFEAGATTISRSSSSSASPAATAWERVLESIQTLGVLKVDQASASSSPVYEQGRDFSAIAVPLRAVGIGQFNSPSGIAVDAVQGNMVVADTDNHRVTVLHSDGSLVRSFGSRGFGPGQFNSPHAVAIDPRTGFIVVADSLNHRVSVWNGDGVRVCAFGSYGSGSGLFSKPLCVAVDPRTSNIIVGDYGNHRVQVWSADGSLLRSFENQFRGVVGVAVDGHTSNIIVVDRGNAQVSVWNADGTFVRSFGSRGSGQGQFRLPLGVAVDARTSNVIVADTGNRRLQVWSADGSFISSFGSQSQPWGVAVNERTGDIVVAMPQDHCLQVW